MDRYFGTNGIRGILNQGFFTLNFIHDMTAAIGRHADARRPVLVGCDGRSTGPAICGAVLSSLSYEGVDCITAGMIPTPCLEYEVKKMRYSGGIMITASHNPPAYNGIKVVGPDGAELSRSDELAIESTYEAGTAGKKPARWGTISHTSGPFQYVPDIISRINYRATSSKKLKVVLDPGNGVQGPHSSELCNRLDCRTSMINGWINGDFPGRGPEPTPDNLAGLSAAVTEGGADVGVAFDGDGDRSIFCDEKGRIVTGDRSALILMRHILESNAGAKVVTCLNSSSAAEKVASEYGSEVMRTKIGSVEVSQGMKDTGALVGFEENGGFMYGRHNNVRDGCMTLALMLEALSESGMTLSELADMLPRSSTTKEKVKCAPGMAPQIMRRLREMLTVSDDRDGLKVELSDSGNKWVLIRPSGTEPAVRVYAEAPTPEEADSIAKSYRSLLLDMDGTSP